MAYRSLGIHMNKFKVQDWKMVLKVISLSYSSADHDVQNELEKTSSSIHKKHWDVYLNSSILSIISLLQKIDLCVPETTAARGNPMGYQTWHFRWKFLLCRIWNAVPVLLKLIFTEGIFTKIVMKNPTNNKKAPILTACGKRKLWRNTNPWLFLQYHLRQRVDTRV